MAQLSLKRPIVFFDLETTGTDHAKDRIVELALIKIHPDGKRESYVRRLNPGMPIPKSSSDIHGILDEHVKDSPQFKHIAHELYDWSITATWAATTRANSTCRCWLRSSSGRA